MSVLYPKMAKKFYRHTKFRKRIMSRLCEIFVFFALLNPKMSKTLSKIKVFLKDKKNSRKG